MKKILKTTFIIFLLLIVGACSAKSNTPLKKMESTGKNEEVATEPGLAMSVEGGTYILPFDKKIDDGTKYLCLFVKIQNITGEEIDISSSDFTLHDENGEKVSAEFVIGTDEIFESLGFETLKNKNYLAAPIVFPVNTEKKYELHYLPSIFYDENESINMKIDLKEFSDNTTTITEQVEQYVQAVFLGSNEIEESKLMNDLKKEKEAFKKESMNVLKKNFREYEPTKKELRETISKLQEINRAKGKFSIVLTELNTVCATVYIKPATVMISDLNKMEIENQYITENGDKYEDYKEANREGEKYFLQELNKKISEKPITTDKDMREEGFELDLENVAGKWKVLSEEKDRNDDFDYLAKAFRGGLNQYSY